MTDTDDRKVDPIRHQRPRTGPSGSRRERPRPQPSTSLADRPAFEPERPAFLVDLPRCIGCHACSVACKTAHDVPLGDFPLRVRWLPRPDRETYAFLPVFSESLCQEDADSTAAGLDPACVRACPTDALVFGDLGDPLSDVARRIDASGSPDAAAAAQAKPLRVPTAPDLKQDVFYLGLGDWMAQKVNRGASLDPRDEDPIYEQE